jgi:hypothetical protein
MKTLFISAAFIVISSTTFTQGNRTHPAKADSSQTVKASALKLAEAKAVLSRANTRQNRNNLATADGGI